MEIKITGKKTVDTFLKEYKDKGVWHLAWSLFWRGYVLFVGFCFVIGFVIGVIGLLLEY